MKRIIPALVLLAAAAVFLVAGTVYINAKTDELINLLDEAHRHCEAGAYDRAVQALDRYDAAYSQDETILILFVRRDMLAELRRIAEPLRDYATEENKFDFCTEAERAVSQLKIIREAQFRLL